MPEWLSRLVKPRSDKKAFDKTALLGSLFRSGKRLSGLPKKFVGGLGNKFRGTSAPAPQRGFMRKNLGRAGTAFKWGVPLGGATGIGYLAGQSNAGPNAAEQLQVNQGNEPNFIQRSMGSLGDYVSEDLGIEGLGKTIKENPYASLGVGAGGGGLLMYLLHRLLSGGFGGQQPQSRAMMY